MKVFLFALAIVMLASLAWSQALIGNCGLDAITGIQLSTGNIYCSPAPAPSKSPVASACSGVIDASAKCPLPMLGI